MADPKKIDDNTIEMEKVIPEVKTMVRYKRSFIEGQIKMIQTQLDAFVEARNAEIKACEDILKAMDALGVVTKVTEGEIA